MTCTTDTVIEAPVISSAGTGVCTHQPFDTLNITRVAKCKTQDQATCVADTDCVYKAFERICFEGETWLKVRHVPSNSATWYEAADHLLGTSAAYGQSGDAAASWNLPFSTLAWTKYLFADGAFKYWLIAEKDKVLNANADYTQRAGSSGAMESMLLGEVSSHYPEQRYYSATNAQSSAMAPEIKISSGTSAASYSIYAGGGQATGVELLASDDGAAVYINSDAADCDASAASSSSTQFAMATVYW